MLRDRRVNSITAVHSDLVLVGTQSGKIWVFDAWNHSCLGLLHTMADAVLCLRHHVDKKNDQDLVFAGSGSGQLEIFETKNLRAHESQPLVIDLCRSKVNCTDCTQHPVACMAVSCRRLYCGCGNDIVLLRLTGTKPEIERRWSVEDRMRGLVLNVAVGSFVWTSTKDSPQVDFWDRNQSKLAGSLDFQIILQDSGFKEDPDGMRVVSLLLQQSLWVGLGTGHVIIIDPSTQQPLSIIGRHTSSVRCMVDAREPAFGKQVSLVLTGGMGFVERPGCKWKKEISDFGHVLMWEAEMCEQAKHLEKHRNRRQELTAIK